MCVTDDGTVWVLHMQQNGGSGGTVTGPVLHYWNGSAWVLVSDDIEGLGTKRAAPSSSLYGPSTLSMDTDGEDIWVCYGVDAGATLIGGGRNTYIKVRKYDVSANSWSTVGSPFHGINSNVGNAVVGEYTRAECAQFGDQPTIRVSPAGVPWVGFTDYEAAIGYEAEWPIYAMMPYVARWTGSTWDVQRLPLDPAFSEPTGFQFIEAESVVASGTSTSYLGRSCVQHAQTTYAADTISFVPPAGRWCFVPWVAKDYISGASMGLKFKWYHNGSPLGFSTDDGASGNTLTDIAWTRWTTNQGLAWVDCDGVTDTISLRLAKTGAGTGNVYVDKVMLIPAEVYVQGTGFGISSAFVDDGQPHVGLFMHRVGENGLGENPGALHQSCLTRPVLDDPDADGYFAPGSNTNTSWNYQTWTYSEWNGSEWEHKWTKMIEEAEPNPENHVYVVTAEDSIASTPPLGHWQQGFGFCTDGIDNYFSSNNGIGQAFGFAGDTISAFKIGADGIEAFTEGPPANLQGPGYPQGLVMGISGFNGWGWDHGPRAINVDVNGNVWLSWNGIGGATGNFTNFLAVAYTPNEGSNGLGGWFAAAEENEDGGYDNTFMPSGCCVSSPDGQYLYVLKDDYIWEDQVAPNEPYTFGVWKCEILPDHKIPLVPIRLTEGPINMNWRSAQRGEIQRVQQ